MFSPDLDPETTAEDTATGSPSDAAAAAAAGEAEEEEEEEEGDGDSPVCIDVPEEVCLAV